MNKPDVSSPAVPDLVRACCQALDDKKAVDIRVLFLGSRSNLADYFILATGTSHPHLRAMRGALEEALERSGSRVLGVDAEPLSGWLVVDAEDILCHLFTVEMRSTYRLESLWRDAEDQTASFLESPAPALT